MSKFILSLICILLSAPVLAEKTVYKKTNPDGSVVFTDKNSTDSEEVKIRKPTTYQPPRLPSLSLPRKKLSPTFNYVLTISQPTNDHIITNQTDVTVAISLQPALSRGYGHQIRYQLGGKSIISQNLSENFKDVSRGTHTVMVSIIDKNGEIISSAASKTIHMKRFFKKPANEKPKPKTP